MDPVAARALSLVEAFQVLAARADWNPMLALGAALGGGKEDKALTPENVADRARAAMLRAGHTPPPE